MSDRPDHRLGAGRAVVFVHGVGRSGAAAWPGQQHLAAERECRFLERTTVGDDPKVVAADLVARLDAPVHLVAHSYGVLAALLTAGERPHRVSSLTLVEPAALALSRQAPHSAAHITALAPVFERAGDATVSTPQFAALFAEANGTLVPDVPGPVLEALTTQLRAVRPPWTIPVDATVVSGIPTLVIIGNDSGMYVEVAGVLARYGATVREVPGSGHRPHDSEEATDAMVQHWLRVEARS